jgi:hypothetical protein
VTKSKGIVIFAYNSTFDYVKIANVCAALAKNASNQIKPFRSTELPVTLITDTFGALQANSTFFDNIIIHDTTETNKRAFRLEHDAKLEVIEWKNMTRADAYDLSPYDQTLLLDCDYLMFDTSLVKLFDTQLEFTCYKDVLDLTDTASFGSTRLSPYSIPMLWATAIYFTKCEFSKAIFDMMKTVKANYTYYAKVYGFASAPYRNDFALSIAHHALSGYGTDNLLPFKLPTLTSTADVVEFRTNGQMLYQYKTTKMHTGRIQHTDVHVMNKKIFTDDIVDRMLAYAKD